MSLDSANPYASPVATEEPAFTGEMVGELSIAHQNRRFINTLVDGFLLNLLSTAGGALVGAVYGASIGRQFEDSDETTVFIVGFLIGMFCYAMYYVAFEVTFGRTPAKYLTGTKVVRKDGAAPTLGQVFGRTMIRFIPIEALSFLFSRHPVRWHDSWSGTRVVRIKPAGS